MLNQTLNLDAEVSATEVTPFREEWLETPVPRLPGTTVLNDRAIHGGSYASNSDALACVGVEFRPAPNEAMPDRGFRCCKDAP